MRVTGFTRGLGINVGLSDCEGVVITIGETGVSGCEGAVMTIGETELSGCEGAVITIGETVLSGCEGVSITIGEAGVSGCGGVAILGGTGLSGFGEREGSGIGSSAYLAVGLNCSIPILSP